MRIRHEYKVEKRGLNNFKYVAVCSCGYTGPRRDLARDAEDDGCAHEIAESESEQEEEFDRTRAYREYRDELRGGGAWE